MSKLSQREQMAYATIASLEEERDTLRAELAGLRTGYDAQNNVIAGLKAQLEQIESLCTHPHESKESFIGRVRLCLRQGLDKEASNG